MATRQRLTVVSQGRLGQVWSRLWANEAELAEGLQWLEVAMAPGVLTPHVLRDTSQTLDAAVSAIALRVKQCGTRAPGEVNHRLRRRLVELHANLGTPGVELSCLVHALAELRADLINLIDLFNEWELVDHRSFAVQLLTEHERVSWALQALLARENALTLSERTRQESRGEPR